MKKHKNSKQLEIKDAIIYCRVSSKKQETEGHGLDSQEERCRKFAISEGYAVEKVFRDTFSGGGDFMQRPAMKELIEYLDAHPHKNYAVVFDDLKRFARDTEFHLKLRSAFDIRNALPKCLNFNFEDSPEGRFVETILAAQNQLDREQNKRQVIQKMKARLEMGYLPFHAPLGYSKVKDVIHGKIDKPNQHAKYVKEALEGFAFMRFLHRIDVVKFLQEKGVLSAKQSPEKALEAVNKMLTDVFYAGYLEYEPWEVARRIGRHEAIISLDVFEKNKKRLSSRAMTHIRVDVREDFELRGLVNCAECNSKMTAYYARGKSGKRHPYYKCQNKQCVTYGKSFRKADIDDGFSELMRNVKATDECIEKAITIFNEVWNEEMQTIGHRTKIISAEKENIEAQITQLSERVGKATDEVLINQYEKQIKKLAERLNEIEEADTSHYNYDEVYRTSSDEVLGVLKNPYGVWVNYNLEQRRRFFNFVFEGNLSYSKEYGYRTPNYSLPLRVFELITQSSSVDVEMGGIEPPCMEI